MINAQAETLVPLQQAFDNQNRILEHRLITVTAVNPTEEISVEESPKLLRTSDTAIQAAPSAAAAADSDKDMPMALIENLTKDDGSKLTRLSEYNAPEVIDESVMNDMLPSDDDATMAPFTCHFDSLVALKESQMTWKANNLQLEHELGMTYAQMMSLTGRTISHSSTSLTSYTVFTYDIVGTPAYIRSSDNNMSKLYPPGLLEHPQKVMIVKTLPTKVNMAGLIPWGVFERPQEMIATMKDANRKIITNELPMLRDTLQHCTDSLEEAMVYVNILMGKHDPMVRRCLLDGIVLTLADKHGCLNREMFDISLQKVFGTNLDDIWRSRIYNSFYQTIRVNNVPCFNKKNTVRRKKHVCTQSMTKTM